MPNPAFKRTATGVPVSAAELKRYAFCSHSKRALELAVAGSVFFRTIASEIAMNGSLEVLGAEALKLAPADRSNLVERLIASLDVDAEVEEAWQLEADRREASLESGAAVEVLGQEAMNRLRSKLAR